MQVHGTQENTLFLKSHHQAIFSIEALLGWYLPTPTDGKYVKGRYICICNVKMICCPSVYFEEKMRSGISLALDCLPVHNVDT